MTLLREEECDERCHVVRPPHPAGRNRLRESSGSYAGSARVRSTSITPGATAFTRTAGASSTASMAPLLAA